MGRREAPGSLRPACQPRLIGTCYEIRNGRDTEYYCIRTILVSMKQPLGGVALSALRSRHPKQVASATEVPLRLKRLRKNSHSALQRLKAGPYIPADAVRLEVVPFPVESHHDREGHDFKSCRSSSHTELGFSRWGPGPSLRRHAPGCPALRDFRSVGTTDDGIRRFPHPQLALLRFVRQVAPPQRLKPCFYAGLMWYDLKSYPSRVGSNPQISLTTSKTGKGTTSSRAAQAPTLNAA